MNSSLTFEILQDNPKGITCMLGNHAIVRGALEAGVQFYACYPGTPSSEVSDLFARIYKKAGMLFEYSVNEKIAVEVAYAACLTGARAMCGMKHVGLSYASDPLATMPYIGVEGGMVIVSAGDPSAITSSNEQDQRHFSKFLYFPVFDPSTAEDARRMTSYAFDFSEKTKLPVILRPTTRVCHTSSMVEFQPLSKKRNEIQFTKDPPRYVPIPVNARRMRMDLIRRWELAENLLAESEFFTETGEGPLGIIASGVAYAYVMQMVEYLGVSDRVRVLKVGAYPAPEKILRSFISKVESILVAEELTPFVEEIVTLSAHRSGRLIPIYGKETGHFPLAFEYTLEIVEDAMRKYFGMEEREKLYIPVPPLPERPPVLCPGCPHRTDYYLAKKVFGNKTIYVNDIGCYTLGYGEPLNCCDILLCMGASITEASGIARMTGQRVVAFIGDSTFFHSGLPALANAVNANDNIVLFILNNYVTAMTGFQPTVAAREDGFCNPTVNGQNPMGLSIKTAALGVGVKDIYSTDPFDEKATLEIMKKAKAANGVSVIICNSPCVVYENKIRPENKRAPYIIDMDKCNGCSLCVRVLGCPAISVTDGIYSIDETLCDGCDLCARICNHDAIFQVEMDVVP